MDTTKVTMPRRYGQCVYLKAECLDEYKKIHAAVWPEVLAQIEDSNIRDYSIHLTIKPRPMLFATFKYVGHDFEGDMARMAADTKVREWWTVTDAMQESPIEGVVGSAEGPGWWGRMEKVFYTP